MPTADTDSPMPSKEKDSSATARKSLSKKPSTKLPQNTNSAPKSERSPNSAQTGQGASSIPANGTASTGTADVMVIDFYLDGNYIPRDLPIFYAIQRFAPSFERDFTHSHAKADAVVDNTTGDCESNRHIPGSYLWNRNYELTYRVRMATADEAPPALSLSLSDSNAHRNGQKLDATSVLAPPPTSAVKLQYVNEFADPRELCKGLKMYRDRGENVSVEESAIREVLVYAIFHLMAVVWRHTQGTGGSVLLSPGEFVNPKISAKVTQQLADPLSLASRCLPQWVGALMHKFGFLFSYECRRQYMMAMYIGIPRSTQKMISASGRTGSALHRLTADRFTHTARIKARVRRQHLLQSVFKMLTKLGDYRSIIDIEFVDEVGTGLGPTLEFYCLASKEFQRRDLKIWRDADASAASEETKECVKSMCGLFPRPEPVVIANEKSPKDLPTSTDKAKSQQPTATDATAERWQYSTSLFHAMGMLLARALYDNRLLDIPLNPVVFAWLKLPSVDSNSDYSESNDNAKVTAADVRVSTDSVSSISTLANLALVDAQLAQSMQKMQAAALNKKSTGGYV
ncbi:hypothetical protein SARC_09641 [Sphaeroforma arctica JP610]|uniref:HECT domain-containing protein n=1 Tax=Sphaeroforma arctica JP610 TaxID=667725 RepID=A0A0L0FN31_9EUKA|nr:hypothetical protein SARC_09641 [Sphaeroforma arctica JP610]KNC77906.1 hypothetical protein SARC_09641 [Sphaeroforma arctica JP610]|eukprot:XP_014151808.1 hypothetical protein SARC_09641 [Sphaeroforma arctica JP610]